MTYCTACGVELSEEAQYCLSCGTAITAQRAIMDHGGVVTSWIVRFAAWLIDVILLSLLLIPLKGVLKPWGLAVPDVISWVPFVSLGLENLLYFGYWTFMEGTYGQSIGKRIVGIRVTGINGRPPTLGQAALQSLGKAFLLPIDCLLGWLLYPNAKRRFFNHISETNVVEARKSRK